MASICFRQFSKQTNMATLCKAFRISSTIFKFYQYNSGNLVQFPVQKCFCSSILIKNHNETTTNANCRIILRYYAKGKDRKKDSKNKPVTFNLNLLSQVVKVEDLTKQLNDVVDRMKEEFVKHFTLRTSLTVLDTLKVEFDGTDYILQELAQIGRKNQNLYVVDLTSFPQVIPNVLKSISASGLGLNPQQDGTTLFIPVPKVTKEHRETLSKNAKVAFVKTKDELRNVQNKFIKSLGKKEGVSEDVLFSAKEQITALTDQQIAVAEELLKAKQNDLKG